MKVKLTWKELDENKKSRTRTRTFNVAIGEEEAYDWALLQARQMNVFDSLVDIQVDVNGQ